MGMGFQAHGLNPHKPFLPAIRRFRTQDSTTSRHPNIHTSKPETKNRLSEAPDPRGIPVATTKTPRCGSFALICTKHLVSPREGNESPPGRPGPCALIGSDFLVFFGHFF
jgi:hypothetical protein